MTSSTTVVAVSWVRRSGSSDHNVYAITSAGKLAWVFPTGGSVHSSPAIAADGTVYIGSTDGNLYAIGP